MLYEGLLRLNGLLNRFRARLGRSVLVALGLRQAPGQEAVNFISEFEAKVAAEAADRGLKGIICGHIHTAEMRMVGETYPTHYVNTAIGSSRAPPSSRPGIAA